MSLSSLVPHAPRLPENHPARAIGPLPPEEDREALIAWYERALKYALAMVSRAHTDTRILLRVLDEVPAAGRLYGAILRELDKKADVEALLRETGSRG